MGPTAPTAPTMIGTSQEIWSSLPDLLDSLSLPPGGGPPGSAVVALISAFCGRAPADEWDARRLASILAGTVPVGFDAVIDALLSGDAELATAAHRLGTAPGSPAGAQIAAETLVGSWKASEYPGANEDLATWTARGAHRLVLVLDGITGAGNGSGYRAAHAAIEAAVSAWEATGDPAELISAGDRAASDAGGGATLVAVDIDPPAARAQIRSLGDSSAWMIRKEAGVTACFRLTPIHTVHALQLLEDSKAVGHESVLTRYLGGRADHPHSLDIDTRPGDLLVVCTDGVEIDDAEPFPAALIRLADGIGAARRPLAPSMAVELVVRAERLSGCDNATAVVISLTA